MPTMKQVDIMISQLSQKYNFSEEDARRFLDLPIEVKSKAKPVKSKPPPTTSPKDTTTREPSAYQHFVKAESAKVRDYLIAKSGSQKLERGQLQRELGARWKAMSPQEKSVYTK